MPSDAPQTDSIAIPIKYHVSPSIITRLASQFTIQNDRTGCYLCFYEAIPPFIVGTADEIKSQLEELESLQAECVARIFIPAARVSDFLAVIQTVSKSIEAPTQEDGKQ